MPRAGWPATRRWRQTNAQNDAVRAEDDERLFAELDHATLLRAVYSERQLFEVMCDFWTNHLNIWRRAKWLTPAEDRRTTSRSCGPMRSGSSQTC